MSKTLLAMVTAACNELGFDAPSMLVGNDDPDATQLLAIAQAAGEDILSAHGWSFLTKEGATLTLVTGQELYPLPADFDRLVGDTSWDRVNKWRTLGPDDPQTARWRRESINDFGPRRALRQVGQAVTVWPVPTTSGDTLAYDYVSNGWALSDAALTDSFALDADTTVFRPRLMVLGIKWRWLAAKGMEATAVQIEYQRELRRAIARDMGGGQVLNMAGPGRCDTRGNADDVVAGGPVAILGTTGGEAIGID